MSSSTSHPWREIAAPHRDGEVVAKRVSAELRYDFFWARDVEGNPLLLLEMPLAGPVGALPRLNGLAVTHIPGNGNSPPLLAWTLARWEHEDLFHNLCVDVMRAAEAATDVDAAASAALARTWRWHHLLRGGTSGRLALREQLGLMAELAVLESIVLPQLDPLGAVEAWRGPFGEPQDFVWHSTAIESKGRLHNSSRKISISSEYQLDKARHAALWLAVSTFRIDRVPGVGLGVTLDETVARIGTMLQSVPRATVLYQTLLTAAGYDSAAKYDDIAWVLESTSHYLVDPTFPAIQPHALPNGVSAVSYALDLSACSASLRDHIDLDATQ